MKDLPAATRRLGNHTINSGRPSNQHLERILVLAVKLRTGQVFNLAEQVTV